VFNAQQIEAIPALEPRRDLEWNPIEQAEKLLKASNARIQHSAQGGAFYRLATDTIHLPNVSVRQITGLGALPDFARLSPGRPQALGVSSATRLIGKLARPGSTEPR